MSFAMMETAGRHRSQSTTSTLSSVVNSTRTPLDTHVAQFPDLDPALRSQTSQSPSRESLPRKTRPPPPQGFLHPASAPHQQTDQHHPSSVQADHQQHQQHQQPAASSFSYPADSSLTYNIHFNPPLFSLSSAIQYAPPPMTAANAPSNSPFAVGAYNAGIATLSPRVQHTRPTPISAESTTADARRGPPTPLPFTHPYSAGYYISTGLTPLYTATQFHHRAVQGDPFFGAVSHLTPTPSCSSFEAAQQDFTGSFAAPMHRPVAVRYGEQVMAKPEPVRVPVSPKSPVKHEDDAKSTDGSKDSRPLPAGNQENVVSPSQDKQVPRAASAEGHSYTAVEQRAEQARPPVTASSLGAMPFEYAAPQMVPNYMSHPIPGNTHHNRVPSFSFPASAPMFTHPAQTYSVLFGPDGQPHYVANPMPQAIQDINGNLTYAYPPQAFQPAQAMSHHAWARQQNAFAYHYGDDADVDAAPTPEGRYGVVSPNGGASRSPAARYRARTEDAEGESDDEYEHDGYAPVVSMKRSRSRSVTSVSEEEPDEWQPKRKMVKVSNNNHHQRKAVDTKRQDGRRALMLMEAEEANGSGRIRYTSNAEDKQTDRLKRECFTCGSRDPPSWRRSCLNHENILCNRCGIYEKTHGIARPFPLDEIPNPPSRASAAAQKKRKKTVKELGLKALQISQATMGPRVNAVNVSSGARGDEENSRAPSRNEEDSEEEESEEEEGEDRRVSLNSNKSGRSAGVTSTASEMTSFGPHTPLSIDDMSPHAAAGPRAKTSAIYAPSSADISYRGFARPVATGKKAASKGFSSEGKGRGNSKKVSGRGHQRRRSVRDDEEDE